ncbi:type IV secretion system protein VirB3 [Legionella spiritensis]|uniref:type IV secretion system protein VirB3 n=1 Tax=Legionella spiritensis TaxID=452 RepID=UPI000F7023EC|nr:VirB3 family type IV secretion system protein [Legionella spiritensis]VEG91769.1 type IV secretion system protein VirB3 [Legionella spiritensis]
MTYHPNTTLTLNPVYGALTRAAMAGGVTFEYHGINLMVSVCAFIALGNLLYGLVFIPLHVFGWLVCRSDTRFFTIVTKRLLLCPPSPNQTIWGVRVYEPF